MRCLVRRSRLTLAPALSQLLHAAVDFADTLDGELSVDHVEGIGRIGDDAGETARGDNGGILAAQLALHARDQALSHGGGARYGADLDALLGIAADGVLGAPRAARMRAWRHGAASASMEMRMPGAIAPPM